MTISALSLFDLTGQTALVTGASRGLGRAMAVALASGGARVMCAGSRPDSCSETVKTIRDAGGDACSVAADCANRAALSRLVEDVRNQVGALDILINNAGIIHREHAIDYSMANWDQVLQVNLDAVFYLSREFGQDMVRRKRGKIINTASLLAFSGGICVPAYTAAKHAIAGLTKALANEWAIHNVQVNAVAPGYFNTDNTAPLRQNTARLDEITARIPAGRWGEPDDLAGATLFLASAASNYVNGHILVVDGGWMAR